MFNWFWRNAVPNISCFQCFAFFCAGSTLNTFEYLHACTSQKMFGNCMCWNFAQNIWMGTMFWIYLGTYFQKICWCEYVLEMSYNRFLQGTFSVYIYMYTYFPTYFLWNILGHCKKGLGNTMTPVRCCKNPIDFLWSIVTRCLLEDVLLQIFGIFVYTPEICLRNIIADIRKNLLRNIWGDWPKLVLRNCFQRYLQYDQVRKMFGKHVPKNVFTVSLGERCIQFFG